MKKILVTSNIKYDKYGNLQNLISQDWFQFLNRLGFSVFTTGALPVFAWAKYALAKKAIALWA